MEQGFIANCTCDAIIGWCWSPAVSRSKAIRHIARPVESPPTGACFALLHEHRPVGMERRRVILSLDRHWYYSRSMNESVTKSDRYPWLFFFLFLSLFQIDLFSIYIRSRRTRDPDRRNQVQVSWSGVNCIEFNLTSRDRKWIKCSRNFGQYNT